MYGTLFCYRGYSHNLDISLIHLCVHILQFVLQSYNLYCSLFRWLDFAQIWKEGELLGNLCPPRATCIQWQTYLLKKKKKKEQPFLWDETASSVQLTCQSFVSLCWHVDSAWHYVPCFFPPFMIFHISFWLIPLIHQVFKYMKTPEMVSSVCSFYYLLFTS